MAFSSGIFRHLSIYDYLSQVLFVPDGGKFSGQPPRGYEGLLRERAENCRYYGEERADTSGGVMDQSTFLDVSDHDFAV